jgi:presenilin-like A22 family membrane protease
MKHTLKVTLILVLFFLFSQIIGLAIISKYIDVQKTIETGKIEVKSLPYDMPRPEAKGGASAVGSIAIAILIGTVLVFLIMRFEKMILWKIWFFMAVSFCLMFAFKAFIPSLYALILALVLAAFKILKPNVYIHNLTELFIYGGLAAIIVPLFNDQSTNLWWAFALLLIISIYDMIAVWKSKHMVKMAQFQTESKVFAGMFIPYSMPKRAEKSSLKVEGRKVGIKTAVLGGGDIGFPLFFSGIVMQNMALENLGKGISNFVVLSYLKVLIIPVFVTIALLILLLKSKKDRFYPAMPFLSIGCLVGYLVLLLIK